MTRRTNEFVVEIYTVQALIDAILGLGTRELKQARFPSRQKSINPFSYDFNFEESIAHATDIFKSNYYGLLML